MPAARRDPDAPVATPCPACHHTGPSDIVYRVAGVPVQSCRLVHDRAAARAFPRGDLQLAVCPACGYLWNAAFQPERLRYDEQYEESQAYSPHFRRYQTEVIERLIHRYALRDKRILEIGCGKGDFLREICQRGNNTGWGFDPAFRADRQATQDLRRVSFVKEYYGPSHADLQPDCVVCRMTLEHVPDPLDFLRLLRRNLADRAEVVVVFQVPDTARILREAAFWDIYYEHCGYFTAASLTSLFQRAGFRPLRVDTEYGDQYLTIEAEPADRSAMPSADGPGGRTVWDGSRLAANQDRWRHRIERLRDAGRRLVLWGSGSKAVAFLTALAISDEVEFVVDVNPHKQGHHLPGSGQRIVAPHELPQLRPDVVLVMNPVYRDEIQAELDRLQLTAELLALGVD